MSEIIKEVIWVPQDRFLEWKDLKKHLLLVINQEVAVDLLKVESAPQRLGKRRKLNIKSIEIQKENQARRRVKQWERKVQSQCVAMFQDKAIAYMRKWVRVRLLQYQTLKMYEAIKLNLTFLKTRVH